MTAYFDRVHSIQAAHAGRKNRMILKTIRWLLSSAERIIAVSAGVAEDLARQAPRIAGRVRVVPNPVPHDDVAAMAAALLDHPWFDEPGVPVILSAGRLVGQKDFSTLIRAFAQVVKSRPARLVILGEGRERGVLAALARELGVAEGVDLPGFVANPFAWMARARARVFAVSSIYEGLSMVLVEAMACGTPVVSTDCPHGPREVLEDGRWGRLVPVGAVGALAAAILETLRDPVAADRLMAGRSRFTGGIRNLIWYRAMGALAHRRERSARPEHRAVASALAAAIDAGHFNADCPRPSLRPTCRCLSRPTAGRRMTVRRSTSSATDGRRRSAGGSSRANGNRCAPLWREIRALVLGEATSRHGNRGRGRTLCCCATRTWWKICPPSSCG